jgi:tRNA-2-methylthio-N6-dimethylallyladenosine synthase
VRPGDVVETVVTYAAPHHLVADGALVSHRRTRAGDNYEEGIRPRTSGVGLGLPSFGPPASEPVSGCAVP